MTQILKGTISEADGLRKTLEVIKSLDGVGSCVLQIQQGSGVGAAVGFKGGGVITGARLESGESGCIALRNILQLRQGAFVVLDTGADPLPELRQGLTINLADVIPYVPSEIAASVTPWLFDDSEQATHGVAPTAAAAAPGTGAAGAGTAAPTPAAAPAPTSGFSPSVIFAYLLCAIIFGTMFFSIRICIQPGGFRSYPAAALRFTIGTVVMAVIWLVLGKKVKWPTTKEIAWILLSGAIYGLGVGSLYVSEEHISGGVTAVLSGMAQLFGIALGVLTGTEKVNRSTVFGSLVALAGVAVVFHDRMQVSAKQATAIGFLMVAMFLFASSNVLNKRYCRMVAMVAFNTFNCLAEALLLWAVAFLRHQFYVPWPPPLAPSLALLYLSTFATAVVFAAYFYLIKQIGVSATMTLWFVSPLIALVVDAVFEKHASLTAEAYVGIAIVLLGVSTTLIAKVRNEWAAKKAAA